MRSIGDKVWIARFKPMQPELVECPDCGGTGRIRLIMHDDTMVSIECGECSSGYEKPTGTVRVYQNSVDACHGTVRGVEITEDGIEYTVATYDGHNYVCESKNVFDVKDLAIEYGLSKQEAYKQEQIDKIAKKEKDTKTWAWNASYHRGCIKRAEKDIEYHSQKLKAANLKAKQDKKDTTK